MAAKSSQTSAKAKKKPRGPGRPFKKGESGNPKGRPKETEEQKKEKRDALEILKAAAPDAAALLVSFANDPNVRGDLRIRCAETVMDRVYGRAAQPIDATATAEIRVVLGDAEDFGG